MIRASMAALCAVVVTFSVPAEACGWKRDGYGWRSAGYGYNEGWGYRNHRPWLGSGYGFRDRGWGHRRHWRGDGRGEGYGWRADRGERRGLFRERRMGADVVTK